MATDMNMPTISVIVPVYKVEKYIHRCVDSILGQTFTDFELILVDDGSPDNCGAICDEYAEKDSRVIVIHQENGGLSAARNAGIDWAFANSDSQWLTFVDSDDWIHPQMLEVLLEGNNNHHTNISVCIFQRTDGEIKWDTQFCGEIYEPKEAYRCNGVNMIVAWGKLYKKECFRNIRYPVGKIHEDEFVTYRLLFAQEKIYMVTTPMYAYYINPEGIMRNKWTPARLASIEAAEEQYAFFKSIGDAQLAREKLQGMATIILRQVDILRRPENKQYRWPHLWKMKVKKATVFFRCVKEKAMDVWLLELYFPRLMAWITQHIRPLWRKIRKSKCVSRGMHDEQ